jgi:hypothetical protein
VHLIPQAFPALHHLNLTSVQLGEGALFNMLGVLASSTFQSVIIGNCSINESALESAAAALARLPSLQSLRLEQSGTMMRLVARVTGLTSLVVHQRRETLDQQVVMFAAGNLRLQKLAMEGSAKDLAAGHLQHLLITCSTLTQLTLHRSIDQDGLDALLTHGTRITHFTLNSCSLTASRAHVPCTWKVLRLTEPSLQQLAYLPLRSVQELRTGWGSPDDTLVLRLNSATTAAQLPSLSSQAASNLAACPACTKQPRSFIGLQLTGSPSTLTAQQHVQLFEALAPLRILQLARLTIYSRALELGSPEVDALVHSLGDGVRGLEFMGCLLLSCVWGALAQRLPHLQELTLHGGVQTTVADLSSFLGLRSQAQPNSLTINMHWGVLDDAGFAELQAHIAALQLQNVRLVRY